ncbi:hypothetical protein [Candidatus Poriferisocius sp.]|uniref:hypothetical protein n=1 Tax=Candidatus Poriferisocius sp. TaxID=3101276 RepID=UPI003B016277
MNPRVRRDRLVLVGLIALFVGLSVQQFRIHPQLGVDEIYYLDYVAKSPSLGLRIGEQVGAEATSTAACKGIEAWPEVLIPDCDDPQPNPNQLWQQGYNVAFQHPPGYFSLTWVGGKVFSWVPGVDDPLTAYRLTGTVWMAVGMTLLWYALTLAGIGVVVKAAVVSLLGAPAAVVYLSASVHPGNVQLVGGALLLVALMLWELGRWRWWSVPIVAAVVVWLNFNNAMAVGTLVVYLVYRAWRDRDQRGDLLITAAWSFAVTIGSVIGWQVWQNSRKLADVDDLPIHQVTWGKSGFQWQQVDDELRAVFTPFRDNWLQTWDVLTPVTGIADVGLVVMMGATLAVAASRSTHRHLVAAVVTAMIGAGLVTMLSTYAAGYNYFQLTPARYGLAILPFGAVAIAPALRQIALARAMTVALALITCAAISYGVITSSSSTADFEVSQELAREMLIADQQRLIADLEDLFEDSEQLIGMQERLIADLEDLVQARDQTISEQRQLIGELGGLLEAPELLIADQQRLIGELEELLAVYRCQFETDQHLVPGGCEVE